MSTQLQLRRGTTAQHSTFTGASGEITIDTDKKTVVVHDGITPGGRALSQFDPSRSNRIINGDMRIDQRNAGASVTPTNGQYTIDRWSCLVTQASAFSVQQNAGVVSPPAGFTNYLGATSLSATSLGSSDRFIIQQSIEGYNVADLNWGTPNAQSITVSFWVRSSLTGTFGGVIIGGTGPAVYPFTYSISAANTWQFISFSVPGPTFDTWGTTNGSGLFIRFSLGCGTGQSGTANSWAASTNISSATGATSVVGTNGATFYITGVQLEKGSVATPFEFRPYGMELSLCQRYYQQMSSALPENPYSHFGLGYCSSTTSGYVQIKLQTKMRTLPTILTSSGTTFNYYYSSNPTISANAIGSDMVVLQLTNLANAATGYSLPLFANNTTAAYIICAAEL